MPRITLRRLREVVGIVLAAALLLSVGALTFVSDQRSATTGDSVHRDDRLQLQTTLSGLTQQYLLLTFGELDTIARTPGWELTVGSKKDAQRISDFLTASPLVSAGAAVVGLDGTAWVTATSKGIVLPTGDRPRLPAVSVPDPFSSTPPPRTLPEPGHGPRRRRGRRRLSDRQRRRAVRGGLGGGSGGDAWRGTTRSGGPRTGGQLRRPGGRRPRQRPPGGTDSPSGLSRRADRAAEQVLFDELLTAQ